MGTLRCFEHQGKIAITGRDGDICIPGLSYAISIEGGELEVFGDTVAGNLFLNRKRFGELEGPAKWKLAAGDQILAEGVSIAWYEGFIELSTDREDIAVALAECEAGGKPFEGFPHFTRSPRLILHAPDKKVEISHPPARASMPKGSLIQMILPPVVMLCITIVIAIVMHRGIFVLMSIASTLMTLQQREAGADHVPVQWGQPADFPRGGRGETGLCL